MPDIAPLQTWLSAAENAAAHQLFVLIDAAVDSKLVASLKQTCPAWAALLDQQGSSIAAHGPHLFQLATSEPTPPALRDTSPAAFTVLAADTCLLELQRHLQAFTTVRLESDMAMGFAFWDPAILGSLVGQKDDATLHIAGPVLEALQLQVFLRPVSAWWYWDRESELHRIDRPPAPGFSAGVMHLLQLTQAQEDLLVEASVPDQILYHLELNQPYLFDSKLPATKRYRFIRAVLGPARELGLHGMRDLVNFTAMCLIYRQRMQTDPTIGTLLDQVRLKQLTLDQAMEKMPE